MKACGTRETVHGRDYPLRCLPGGPGASRGKASSPMVMLPKPRVISRSLCSFSWCFDSFRTLLAHNSRFVNTEWITPNLKSTNTRQVFLSSPGKVPSPRVRRRCPMCMHTRANRQSSSFGHWSRWLRVIASWHSAFTLNLPVFNSLSVGH